MVVSAFGRRLLAGISASIVLASIPLSAMATTDGPNYPSAASNVADIGVTAWSNPGNVGANDNSYATVSTGASSQYLRARDYGFAIPSDATIKGIEVIVGRKATQNGGPGARDVEVKLVKNAVIGGTNMAQSGVDWATSEESVSYGSNTELWGLTWTPANINAASFGAAVAIDRNGETADIDYIRIKVSYTVAQDIFVSMHGPTNAEYGSTFNVAATSTSGLAVSITTTGGCSIAATTVTMTSGTSDCVVHYNQAGNGTYTAATEKTDVVTALKKPLTITASNQMKTYGTPFVFTGTEFGYSVLVGSDSVTGATLMSAGASAGASAAASPYAITVSNAMGAGLSNYDITYDNGSFTVNKASQTINVTMSAPGSASNGSMFTVAANSTSALVVDVTTSGGCTNAGNDVTMTSDSVTCVVHYNQSGDTNYNAAVEITENVTALPVPPVTCDATLNAGDNIQNAINAASSGDVICLNPGTYTIASAINVNKSVTLTRTNCDPNALVARTAGSVNEAIINGNNAVGNAILISTNNVEVSCLEVKNTTGDAVTSVNANPPKTGVVVKNNIVHNAGDEGIQLKRTDGAIIRYNEVYSTTGDGINISENTSNGQILDNKVHDSSSTDGAIYVYDSLNTTIQGNLLYNVSTNDAIKLGNKNGSDIAKAGGVIAENIVVTGSQDAISIYMSSVEVYGNKIKNSTSAQGAIYVRGGNNTINIHDNLIVDNSTTGVKVGGAGIPTNVLVNDNCIEGNNAGLTLIAGSALLNAEDNWWGAPSGPSGAGSGTGDTVAANVDYMPFNSTGCGLAPIVDLNNDGIPDGSDDPLAVGPFSTTTSLMSDLNPSVYADTVTFTATVTGTTPTGTVSFYSGATLLGTDTLDGSFQATLSIATLGAGSNNIEAVYGGDMMNVTSTSSTVVQVVTQKSITVTPTAGQDKVYGDADPTLAYSNDALSFSDTMTGSLARTAGEDVGMYAITLGTLTAGPNYALTLDAETFEITVKTINVTPNAGQTKVYGDADPTLTYTNDMLSFSDAFTGELSRDAGEDVGTYNITIGTLDAGTNYTLVLAAETFDITQLATVSSTVLDTPTPNSLVGSGVVLKATVTGSNPTGTVEFYSGSLLVGSSTLLGDAAVSHGSGSITHTFTYAGSYSLTAKYLGDANHIGSFSADPLTVHIVDKDSADTVTTMSSSGSSLVGTGVTLTATVLGAYNPTGTVEFYDGGNLIGSAALDGSFQAKIAYVFTVAGNHDLTARYFGDANNNESTSIVEPVFVQEVRKDSADTVTTMSSSGSSLVGTGVTLTATVAGAYNPTGMVEFYDGASLIGSASLNGSFQASVIHVFTAAGVHNLSSHYLGDTNNNASVSAVEIIFVQQVRKDTPDTVTTMSSSGSSLVGTGVTLTATVSGAYVPTGTVEFYDGGNLIGSAALDGSFQAKITHTFTLAGMHDLVAHYLGDDNNNESFSAIEPVLVQEVRKNSPETDTVLSVANPSTIGDMLTFTADVLNGYNPTGVVFFRDGGVFIGSGALVGGTATFSTDQLAVGSHDITAEYQGDVNNNPSVSAVVTVQIVQQKTSTTILADLPTELDGPAPLTFNVTVNGFFPTGTVAIWDGGSFLLNVTLSNGSGSFTQIFAGSDFAHTYRAEYPGDVNNTASTSSEKTVTIHLGTGESREQGAAANRGNNIMRSLSIVRFAANLHLGDLPPGSFGGADAPLAGAEKEYVCSIQRSLPMNARSSYIDMLAALMAQYSGRTADVIADWLHDPSLCSDITVSRSGIVTIAQAILTPFRISSEGFPLSENPTWNKCVTGKFTYADIQANPDRDRKGTPKSCSEYHTGSSWYHPDLHLFFDWNLGTKKLTLPAGYVIQKDEAVTVR